jgi:hypothetical protein
MVSVPENRVPVGSLASIVAPVGAYRHGLQKHRQHASLHFVKIFFRRTLKVNAGPRLSGADGLRPVIGFSAFRQKT